MNADYLNAVRLLLKVAPYVFGSDAFALKGGTAINLFFQELQRLSVDLDLVYRNHSDSREDALRTIESELREMESHLLGIGLFCERAKNPQGDEVKLFVAEGRVRIKVEINYVFRGTILPIEMCALRSSVEDLFFTELALPLLSPEELYGSKLVAAMDRQHPRDLFDVSGLYQDGGLSEGVIECFVCYIAGHNRPVHEVLFARESDIAAVFVNEFNGMTQEPVELDALLAVRRRLFSDLPAALTSAHRAFLLSLVKAEPDWGLMSCAHLSEMPALRWKLRNLERLRSVNRTKFEEQAEQLADGFGHMV